MSTVLTQNNLIDVIKSEIEGLNSIVDLITSSVSDTINKLPKNWNQSIKKYKVILNDIFGDSGIINDIQKSLITLDKNFDITQLDNIIKSKILSKTFADLTSLFNSFNNISISTGIRLKVFILKKQLRYISELTDVLEEANLSLKQAIINRIAPDGLKDTIADIQAIFDIVESIKINVFLIFKIKWIRFAVTRIKKLVKEITSFADDIKLLIKSLITFKLLTLVLAEIQNSINLIRLIKVNPLIIIKIKIIKFAVNQISKLMSALEKISSIKTPLIPTLINLIALNSIIIVLQNIIENVQEIKIKISSIIKFWMLKKIVIHLGNIANELFQAGNQIKSYNTVLKRWAAIVAMFYFLRTTINIIVNTKMPFLFKRKLKVINKTTLYIKNIIKNINDIKIKNDLLDKIKTINKAFRQLRILFNTISRISLIAALSPIGLIMISFALKFIGLFIITISTMFKGVRLKDIIKNFTRLNRIFKLIGKIFYTIVVISPLAVLAMPGLVIIYTALGFLTLTMRLIALLTKGMLLKHIVKGLLKLSIIFDILLLLTVKITIISLAAVILAPNFINILIFLGILVSITLAVGLLGFVIGSITPIMAVISIGLLLLTSIFTMLFVIALELIVLAKIAKSIVESKDNLLLFLDTVIDITKDVGSLGWDMLKNTISLLFVIPGLTLMTMIIGVMTFIALELLLIQVLPIDAELIHEKIKAVLDTVHYIIDNIFNTEDPAAKESDKTWIENVIQVSGIDKLSTIVDAIMSVAFLATTFFAITMIVGISLMLAWIQKINLDPAAITEKVNLVINTALMVIDSLFNREEPADNPTEKSWIAKVVNTLGLDKLKMILDAITSVGFLAVSMVSVMLISELATQLNTIQNVDLQREKISEKVSAVISTSNMVSSAILASKENDKIKIKDLKETSNYLEQYVKIFKKLDKNASLLANIGSYSSDSVANGKNNILNVLNSIDEFAKVNKVENKNAKNLLEDYSKFITKINSVDLEKLKTTNKLFENMARMSESINGNFSGLAETLNENIAPILEELKESINELPDLINNASSKVVTGINTASSSSPILDRSIITKQVQLEDDKLSEEEVAQEVENRMKILISNQTSSIGGKLDKLIHIFETGQATVKASRVD